MEIIGKWIFFAGLTLSLVGGILWAGFGKGWFGMLPGDIRFQGERMSFFFPVTTCLVISGLISLIMWWLRR